MFWSREILFSLPSPEMNHISPYGTYQVGDVEKIGSSLSTAEELVGHGHVSQTESTTWRGLNGSCMLSGSIAVHTRLLLMDWDNAHYAQVRSFES